MKQTSKNILVSVVVIAIVGGIAGFIFNAKKLPTYELSIRPTELSPFVSHEQARATICSTMKGQLFDEICQEKFDRVGKNDAEKIGALFSLIKKIENGGSISDYDRLLLAQAIFASLPTKDSPLARHSGSSALFAKLKNFINGKNVAHAQESDDYYAKVKEENKKIIKEKLVESIKNIPEKYNSWIVVVMVSRYEWVNGVQQPIYSEQYAEVFDPYPAMDSRTGEEWEFPIKFAGRESMVTKSAYESGLETHTQSFVSSLSTSERMNTAQVENLSGEQVAVSISVHSYYSRPYDDESLVSIPEEARSPELHLVSNSHDTEEGYQGEDLISEVLEGVEMPSREGRAVDTQEKTEANRTIPPHGTPISKSDYDYVIDQLGCDGWMVHPETGLYCYTQEELDAQIRVVESGKDLSYLSLQPPTYPFYDGNQPWQAPAESAPEEPFSVTPDSYTDQQVEKIDPQPNYDDCQKAANGTCIPGSPWTESR